MSNKSGSSGIVVGVIMIVLGGALGYFVFSHRPLDLEDMIKVALENPDHWMLKPPIYYVGIAIAALLFFGGIAKCIKAKKAGDAGGGAAAE